MNLFIENYSQLFAVAAPVVTLAVLNLLLAFGGERGTLLLPSAGPFEAVRRAANAVPAASAAERAEAPANDPDFRCLTKISPWTRRVYAVDTPCVRRRHARRRLSPS
jgi:hypothetical protein